VIDQFWIDAVMSEGDGVNRTMNPLALFNYGLCGVSRPLASSSVAAKLYPNLFGLKTTHGASLVNGNSSGMRVSRRQTSEIHTGPAFNAKAVMEEVKHNPFFEKYKNKINTSNEEELARKVVEAREKNAEEETDEVKMVREKLELLEEKHPEAPVKLSKKNRPSLDDILRVDLLSGKPKDEIEHIWLEYHKTKAANVISAVVPPAALHVMTSKARDNPMFLYTVPRGQGFEFIFGQWSGNDCYFTPLIQYQTHGENAPVALTIHHFDELKSSKDVVLMRGEFDPNVLTPVEAQFLAMQMQMYYGEKVKPSKMRLLHNFNHRQEEFKHMDLVAELDMM